VVSRRDRRCGLRREPIGQDGTARPAPRGQVLSVL
jgi:hypothetical protein